MAENHFNEDDRPDLSRWTPAQLARLMRWVFTDDDCVEVMMAWPSLSADARAAVLRIVRGKSK